MHSTKKLFESFQGKPKIPPAALVLVNPYPCETEKMNIQYFFHLSLLTFYWFTLFSQQFSDRFPNVDSVNSLIFILWLPLKMSANFGLRLRTQEPQALHTLGANMFAEFYWVTMWSWDLGQSQTLEGRRFKSAWNPSCVCEPVHCSVGLGGKKK